YAPRRGIKAESMQAVTGLRNVTQDYGAAGDGIVDDTAAIQNALHAAGGDIVFLPPRTHRITDSIVIRDNVTLKGTGIKSVIRMDAVNRPAVIVGTDVDDSGIEDLFIDVDHKTQVIGLAIGNGDGGITRRHAARRLTIANGLNDAIRLSGGRFEDIV